MSVPLLSASNLSRTFISGQRRITALDDVSLSISHGETVGLVGPSGSGKTTLSRVLLRLIQPDSGRIEFSGSDFLALRGQRLRAMRRRIQMVFQEPLAAFNPRATVGGALLDPLRIHRISGHEDRQAIVASLLQRVGLDPALASRAIHEISGGQRQRVAIARALATEPDLIILDEAVSALDVSVRAKILDLLVDLQRERGMAYLFVSHDLAVVHAISHRIAIMDAGRVVEEGAAGNIVTNPRSRIGQALVSSTPRLILHH